MSVKRVLVGMALAASAASCATASGQARDLVTDARALPGHAVDAARRAAAPPQLSPVQSPAPLVGPNAQGMPGPGQIAYSPGEANSLWRPGARSFFNDQRAHAVGDILTVQIEIADKAQVSNSSDRQRSSSTSVGVPHFLGLETAPGRILPGGYDPSTMVEATADSSQSGQGSIQREEKVELTVAAVIVDVLPNGNLVIAGRQEVRINAELRELTVSGIIRPEDIGADNTIRHDQIAEARISYGGQGQLSAVQRPSWGQRIVDAISPW